MQTWNKEKNEIVFSSLGCMAAWMKGVDHHANYYYFFFKLDPLVEEVTAFPQHCRWHEDTANEYLDLCQRPLIRCFSPLVPWYWRTHMWHPKCIHLWTKDRRSKGCIDLRIFMVLLLLYEGIRTQHPSLDPFQMLLLWGYKYPWNLHGGCHSIACAVA